LFVRFFVSRLSNIPFKHSNGSSERYAIQFTEQSARNLAVQLLTVNNAQHSEAVSIACQNEDKGLRGLLGKNECNQRRWNAFVLTAVTGKFRYRISVFVSL
jgi:hypothetical protein